MKHGQSIEHLATRFGADHVVAALAEAVAVSPPAALRHRLVAEVGARPRRQVGRVPAPQLYASRVAALADLLDALGPDEFALLAAPYAWTVHELVAHLAVIEEYTARQFGLAEQPPLHVGASSTVSHLDMGLDEIAELAASDPIVAVRRWRAAAALVVDHVHGRSFDPAAPAPLHAWPFDATTALVARAFEIWTHADDIRRATDRPLDVPAPGELRTMSSTSVGGLPVLLAVTDGPPLQPTRVVLTGAGGGTFDLPAGRANDPTGRQLLVVDVVDYCRMVARRIDLGQLVHQREGDADFIDAILRAARTLAV